MGGKQLTLALAIALLPLITQAQWTQHTVTTSLDGGFAVVAGDFDNDSDIDIAGSSSGIVSPTDLRWYENTGDGWVDHLLTAAFDGKELVAADLDGDGDTDLAGVSYAGYVSWWENTGAGTFTRSNLSWQFDGGYALDAGDIDLDGDIDLAGAATSIGDITWWENTGGDWTEHVLHDLYAGAHAVGIGDISGDGLPDVAAGSAAGEDNVTWFENAGAGTWPQVVVDDNQQFVASVDVADFDGNGYADIVATDTYGGAMLAFMPNGDGTYETVTLTPDFGSAWHVDTGDIDGDGFPDAAGCSMYAGVRYWLWNGNGFTQQIISNSFGTSRAVNLADIDQDGDLDIVAVNEDGVIAWWEQPGDGQPDPVELTVTPHNPPVIVPAGGSFSYDVHIVSHLQTTVFGYVWSEAELPNGSTFGPLSQVYLPFTPTTDILAQNLSQTVPAMAPAGDYQWRINIGTGLQNPLITNGFGFTVTSARANGATKWSSPEWKSVFTPASKGKSATGKPHAFAVSEAYPNPFNSSTRVNVTLPEAARVRLTVHNTLGQTVLTLADGTLHAGRQEFELDGSSLSSGVYFVNAAVEGQAPLRQKIVLMK